MLYYHLLWATIEGYDILEFSWITIAKQLKWSVKPCESFLFLSVHKILTGSVKYNMKNDV